MPTRSTVHRHCQTPNHRCRMVETVAVLAGGLRQRPREWSPAKGPCGGLCARGHLPQASSCTRVVRRKGAMSPGAVPQAKLSRTMVSEMVSSWAVLIFAHRRRKLAAYSLTDSVSPCCLLKNAQARLGVSLCSPQFCSRMSKIFAGVLTSSAQIERISGLAHPSSAPRSQTAATGLSLIHI